MGKYLKTGLNWIVIGLLAGFACGVFLGRWYAGENFCGRFDQAEAKARLLEKFNRRLRLTEEQRNKIAGIFEAQKPKMMVLREETRPKFESLRNETNAAIRELLTADQQAKFDEMAVEMENRRQNRYRLKYGS